MAFLTSLAAGPTLHEVPVATAMGIMAKRTISFERFVKHLLALIHLVADGAQIAALGVVGEIVLIVDWHVAGLALAHINRAVRKFILADVGMAFSRDTAALQLNFLLLRLR